MKEFPAKAQRRKDKTLPLRLCVFAGVLLFIAVPSVAQVQYKPADYARTEAMIPMHDGVRLYTTIDAPAQATESLPLLLLRTPYGLGADAYEWYLNLGPLSNADKKYFHGKLPTWTAFVNEPDYSAFWKRQGFAPWLNRVTVPILNVAGWWDQEDFYGPIKIYELLERHDTGKQNFLVVGPWNHGGWSRGDGSKLGRIDFGSPTAAHYRRNILAPFFAHYLKGKGTSERPEALTFRTGVNQWVEHNEWPPKRNVAERRLYFQANRKLSFDTPSGTAAFDSYISDPAAPVPYRPRPIQVRSGWPVWLVEDQRVDTSS